MESKSVKGKPIPKQERVYVLRSYYPDESGCELAAFKSFDGAKKAMIALIKQDFADCGGQPEDDYSSDTESYDDSSDTEKEQKIPKELRKEYEGFMKKYKKPYSKKDLDEMEELEQTYLTMSLPEVEPGFDRTNWDHMEPLIIKELEDKNWEYENKYGCMNYEIHVLNVKK